MAFPRQDDSSGLPFFPPGDLPDPGTEPRCPVLQTDIFSISATREVLSKILLTSQDHLVHYSFWVPNTLPYLSKDYFFFFFSFTLFYFTILYRFCHTLTWIHHGCDVEVIKALLTLLHSVIRSHGRRKRVEWRGKPPAFNTSGAVLRRWTGEGGGKGTGMQEGRTGPAFVLSSRTLLYTFDIILNKRMNWN